MGGGRAGAGGAEGAGVRRFAKFTLPRWSFATVVLLIYGLQMGVRREPPYRFLFIMLNSFMLYTMALLSVGAVVS